MLVYLMRHGIAEERRKRAHDRDRELTPEGVQKTRPRERANSSGCFNPRSCEHWPGADGVGFRRSVTDSNLSTAAAFPAPSGGRALPAVSLPAYGVVFYSLKPGKTSASGRGRDNRFGHRWLRGRSSSLRSSSWKLNGSRNVDTELCFQRDELVPVECRNTSPRMRLPAGDRSENHRYAVIVHARRQSIRCPL